MSKKEYNPVEALRESNEEALRATPRENIQNSLRKHVPLQGVAVIPPGRRQFSGEIMMYREGDDLMRDSDAPGGAYKRWDGVVSYIHSYYATSMGNHVQTGGLRIPAVFQVYVFGSRG